mmetsp:Transcript_25443/g.71475  ORF Transcript_25443/g.71475 Transcript_25443/m.71475 type:complete len:212 (+) Transcript_25443:703-1338(+)
MTGATAAETILMPLKYKPALLNGESFLPPSPRPNVCSLACLMAGIRYKGTAQQKIQLIQNSCIVRRESTVNNGAFAASLSKPFGAESSTTSLQPLFVKVHRRSIPQATPAAPFNPKDENVNHSINKSKTAKALSTLHTNLTADSVNSLLLRRSWSAETRNVSTTFSEIRDQSFGRSPLVSTPIRINSNSSSASSFSSLAFHASCSFFLSLQ